MRGPGEGERTTPCTNPASLIRQLDSQLPAGVPLTIIVPAILQDMDAERPRLSRPVTWKITPGEMPTTTAHPPEPLTFSLRGPGQRALRAAIAALNTPGQPLNFDTAAPSAPLPTPPTILVWLTPGALPQPVRDWITAGGTALTTAATPAEPSSSPENTVVPWRDSTGAALVEANRIGSGRLFRFTPPLTPAATPDLLEPVFPTKLAALFTPPPPQPTRVAARDIAPTIGARAWPQPAHDLQPLLALIIAALFVAERWLATRRSRAVTP
ncbi:MAG: hypothetical protein H7267_08040 [Sandarakinorhabdus sp.]|nr:hypothetical protein [Sandarakinorhabdus sp.]